jgi:hypothetical protein
VTATFSRAFGRTIAPDNRDQLYLMRDVLPDEGPQVTSQYWDDHHWWGDQGETPQCVGYSWAHWIEDGPVVHLLDRSAPPVVQPSYIYYEAQKVDEWEGEDYDGTSVRAGVKVLHRLGYVTEYRWAWDARTVADTVLAVGPVVVGTWWTEGMSYPDGSGRILPTGRVQGGHAYVINGYDEATRLFRVKNSWGPDWGVNGYGFLHFDDLDALLRWDGEACLAIEARVPPPPPPKPRLPWWWRFIRWVRRP